MLRRQFVLDLSSKPNDVCIFGSSYVKMLKELSKQAGMDYQFTHDTLLDKFRERFSNGAVTDPPLKQNKTNKK